MFPYPQGKSTFSRFPKPKEKHFSLGINLKKNTDTEPDNFFWSVIIKIGGFRNDFRFSSAKYKGFSFRPYGILLL